MVISVFLYIKLFCCVTGAFPRRDFREEAFSEVKMFKTYFLAYYGVKKLGRKQIEIYNIYIASYGTHTATDSISILLIHMFHFNFKGHLRTEIKNSNY